MDRLRAAARTHLASRFPDLAEVLQSRQCERPIEIFVYDALSEQGIGGVTFQHLDPEDQERRLEHIEGLIFDGLSEALYAFTRKKIEQDSVGRIPAELDEWLS